MRRSCGYPCQGYHLKYDPAPCEQHGPFVPQKRAVLEMVLKERSGQVAQVTAAVSSRDVSRMFGRVGTGFL